MNTPDNVFTVAGQKISSMIFTTGSLRFSSALFQSKNDFEEAWARKLSLATKVEIPYDKIRSVSREIPGSGIKIKYKGVAGLPSEIIFSYPDPQHTDLLFAYLKDVLFFQKSEGQLSPWKATSPYIVGMAITLAIVIFCHYQVPGLTDPDGLAKADAEAHSGKVRLFNHLISALGYKGVWAVGLAICGYIGYKIWQRWTNPPNHQTFLPQNG